ncbi:unnamed protein product [Gordionus sp. m RMFG-2023]|uniref:D-aminoacyl-tRNA deacylase 1-like n=1 Tax=Gordionus sp. m RMFG-2023 TaxID=3053472 RepID=UPI0030DEB2AE
MKIVIQRVSSASVLVDGKLINSISKGLCLLIGITTDDTEKDADMIAKKVLDIKLFEDEFQKRWAKNVVENEYEILSLSQFTLHATLKGRKPDFHKSMAADLSKELYQYLLNKLRNLYSAEKIKEGVFGAYCQVNIVNDGPVTILLDSKNITNI